jgi:hypothetical protein
LGDSIATAEQRTSKAAHSSIPRTIAALQLEPPEMLFRSIQIVMPRASRASAIWIALSRSAEA